MDNIRAGYLCFSGFYGTVLQWLTLPYIDFLRMSRAPLVLLCLILSFSIPVNSRGMIINETSPAFHSECMQCGCGLVRNMERSMKLTYQDVHLFCFIKETSAEIYHVAFAPMFRAASYWDLNEVFSMASRLCSDLVLQEADLNAHSNTNPLPWR